jgi:hypothetical protein
MAPWWQDYIGTHDCRSRRAHSQQGSPQWLLPVATSSGIAESAAGVRASIPWQDPAGGLKISDSVVEAARDAVSVHIADRAVVPTELLDKMATDRGAAFGVHNKSS